MGFDEQPDSLEALLQPDDARDNNTLTQRKQSSDPDFNSQNSEGGASHHDKTKPAPPVAVEAIVLRGQSVPVETVWTAELPRSPEDFSVDVNLSNGMTVVVNNRASADGRWFVVAKDASSKRNILARFHKREPLREWPGLHHLRQVV